MLIILASHQKVGNENYWYYKWHQKHRKLYCKVVCFRAILHAAVQVTLNVWMLRTLYFYSKYMTMYITNWQKLSSDYRATPTSLRNNRYTDLEVATYHWESTAVRHSTAPTFVCWWCLQPPQKASMHSKLPKVDTGVGRKMCIDATTLQKYTTLLEECARTCCTSIRWSDHWNQLQTPLWILKN